MEGEAAAAQPGVVGGEEEEGRREGVGPKMLKEGREPKEEERDREGRREELKVGVEPGRSEGRRVRQERAWVNEVRVWERGEN